MSATVHPFASFQRDRFREVSFGIARSFESGSRKPAFVKPDRLLAEHPRTCVVREPGESLVDEALGFRRSSRSDRGGSALEPREAIPGVPPPELLQDVQSVVVALLAVVQQDQRESRIVLTVAAEG